MGNFDLSALAFSCAFPSNKLIMDDVGMPGCYVEMAKQNLSALLVNGDSTVHPAFRIGGVEKDSLFFGKYEGSAHNNRIYSLPGVDPKANINHDTYVQYCRNKGAGHHCITAAEWAFLALWCKKNSTQPYGNNNYGKDSRESSYLAIPSMARDGSNRIQRVATGTGPLKWSHNFQLDGIWDLNGNVWELVAGIRLVKGELQVIPYNDAALPDVSLAANSAQWKALSAAATGYEDLFITPDGSGTTTGSIKLDYVSSHWQWDTTITSQSDSSRYAAFASTTYGSDIGSFAKLYLQAMALGPEESDTDYEGDYIYANNGADERAAIRGGNWVSGANGGVFSLYLGDPRSHAYDSVGGRPAFYK